MSTEIFDKCTSFYLNGGIFAGRLVRLDKVVTEILTRHAYPLNVSTALTETTALAVLLAAALKYEGLFTLQIQGNGPVSLLVVDVTADGRIRACARFDQAKLDAAKKLRKTADLVEEVPHLVGGGYMAFTVDQGKNTTPYQGIVDLQGNNLTELALRYFKQSEQIDTALKLFVKAPEDDADKTWKAGGILLQRVPLKGGTNTDLSEDPMLIWGDLQAFVGSLRTEEIFDTSLDDAELLNRLFHGNDLKIGAKKDYRFGCRCSRDKLLDTLSGFSDSELDAMTENGKITATCHFCSETYVFDRAECVKRPEKLN